MSDMQKLLADMDKKARFDCPYCCTCALFEFSDLRKVGLIEIRESICPNPSCSKVIIQVREVDTSLIPKSLGGFKLQQCLSDWVTVWPKIRVLCSDEKIPSEIRKDLNEAYSIIEITPDAAAALTRRALERSLRKYLKLTGKDLYKLIEKSKDILHPRIFKLLDTVREFGNFGAHLNEDDNGECLFVEHKEADFAIQAVKELVNEEFVNKHKADEMIEQLKAKKESVKKK